MFGKSVGYKAQLQDMTLFVASDFDEWRILIETPRSIINGGRQFTEAKAKASALSIAEKFMQDEMHAPFAVAPDPEWMALEPGTWLNWRP